MNLKKNIIFLIIVSLFLTVSCFSFSQDRRSVLTPDNANEARLNKLQPPEQVMNAIGIRPGMVVAEIGAGRGRYAVQLAVRVGESGRVYAEDIDEASLDYLRNRCQRWELNNIDIVLGEVTDPNLPAGEMDVIFIISSYHHFADPISLLKRAKPSLKPDGTLAIGEWLTSTTPEKVKEQVEEAGFHLDRVEKFLEKNNFYIYIFSTDTL